MLLNDMQLRLLGAKIGIKTDNIGLIETRIKAMSDFRGVLFTGFGWGRDTKGTVSRRSQPCAWNMLMKRR